MFWPYITQLISIIIFGLLLWMFNSTLYRFRLLFQICALLQALVIIYVVHSIPNTSNIIRMKREKKKHRVKLFNKKIILLITAEITILAGFFITPGFIFLNYLYNVLGFTILTITLVEVFDTSFRGLASIFHEKIESSGKLIVFTISLIISSLAGIFLFMSQYVIYPSFLLLVIIISMILMGLGESMWWIQHEAVLIKVVPEDRRGEVFGLISSARSLINIITPIISAYIASKINPLAPFLVYSVLVIISIPIYYISLSTR